MEVSKEQRKKKSLRSLLLYYLFSITLSVIMVIMVYTTLLTIGLYNGFLLPANTFSSLVNRYEDTIRTGKNIDLDKVPEEIPYVIFDSHGEVYKTTMSKTQTDKVKKYLKNTDDPSIVALNNMQKQYRVVKADNYVYVFEYFITAEFSSAFLRRIFPHVEWTLFIVLLIFIIIDIFAISVLYAGKLSKKVIYMKQAADYIKEKKLDFDIQMTGIKEFDEVMISLDDLKKNLDKSLNSQWKLQQQKKEQMGALAHDIKTPLTVIRGNADLLFETKLTIEQQNYVSYISSNTKKIQEYVVNLIEVSKGKQANLNIKELKLADFLLELEKQIYPHLNEKKLKLEVNHKIEQETIKIDSKLFQRAFFNLVDNAVQYSKEHGTIYFETWEEAEFCFFAIEDEGNGFSSEDLKYAKTEFYRAKHNRIMDGHFGMGLYITNKIAKQLEGSLIIANGKRGGRVTLRMKKK